MRKQRSRRFVHVSRGIAAAAGATLLCAQLAARADVLSVINGLRLDGCPAAGSAPVQRSSPLDAAARELARDPKLEAALARVGYPAASSSSFHVRGSRDDAVVRRLLAERYCASIVDAKFTELGWHQDGDESWIVLAVRTPTPFAELRDPEAVARRVLELVNAARAVARDCGRERFEAAAPLTAVTTLDAAAALHARDLAEHRTLSHTGSDGSAPGDRITRAGYVWRGSAENIAAGQPNADAVVAGWLTSPGHCAALMAPRLTDTGIAFALAPNENPAIYWVQVFAAPR
jgi:uncharacterized protein YkwD